MRANLRRLAAFLAMVWLAPSALGTTIFSALVYFDGTNGAAPKAGLIQGADGNLYGTTVEGGTSNAGTIFRISPDGQTFTNLYSFTGGADGASPSAALAQGSDGNFYGTAYSGGASNAGTVFQITPGGAFNLLASLPGANGTNGAQPDAALVQASDGSWYGATDDGGPFTNVEYAGQDLVGYGTVFRVTTNGELTAAFCFANTNGARPETLAIGPDGSFYGTTLWGGNLTNSPDSLGYGTIFHLSTNGILTTLYAFKGGSDGGWPYAGLVLAKDGNFYGTTFNGGELFYDYGVVFRITPGGTYTNLHTFAGSDGANPVGVLIQGSDGNLYGTTSGAGGGSYLGTIFRIGTNGAFTSLHTFTGAADGKWPFGALLQASDGTFWGTTSSGGAYTNGVIFRVSLPIQPVIQAIIASPTNTTLTWSSAAFQQYRLQYSTNLAQTNWTTLGSTLTATNGTVQATDSPPSGQARWYRVLALP